MDILYFSEIWGETCEVFSIRVPTNFSVIYSNKNIKKEKEKKMNAESRSVFSKLNSILCTIVQIMHFILNEINFIVKLFLVISTYFCK